MLQRPSWFFRPVAARPGTSRSVHDFDDVAARATEPSGSALGANPDLPQLSLDRPGLFRQIAQNGGQSPACLLDPYWLSRAGLTSGSAMGRDEDLSLLITR